MLADKLIIFPMAAYPEPLNALRNGYAKRPIVQSHTHTPETPGTHTLELKRWVRQILFEQRIVALGEFLYIPGQPVKALPETT